MEAVRIPTTAKRLASLVAGGEGSSLEFKRSTGELKEAMRTLCAFLNGSGGTVLFGVRHDGTVEGQAVSDQTLRDIAQAAERFEPPVSFSIHRIKVKAGGEVIVIAVEGGRDVRPFTYEGRAYERVGSTTRRMTQAKYEKTLFERAHSTRRWENEPADGVRGGHVPRPGWLDRPSHRGSYRGSHRGSLSVARRPLRRDETARNTGNARAQT